MASVAVVVLGDVGRSPRMQYHCTSLARLPDTQVSLVGFRGERCIEDVESNPRISQFLIGTPFAKMPRSLFLLYAPLKVFYQIFQLMWILLWRIPRPRAILVQNPPSIPALLAVWLACRLRGARMVIDWHNFGYTVLGLSLGRDHPLVKFSLVYERFFARRADGHICVTDAMRQWMRSQWGVTPTVLYDRPPPFFKPTGAAEKHDLFSRLASGLPSDADYKIKHKAVTDASTSGSADTTLFTVAGSQPLPADEAAGAAEAAAGGGGLRARKSRQQPAPAAAAVAADATAAAAASLPVELRRDRPALLISSTSWTEDEDFGVLLDALIRVDAAAVASPDRFPNFLVVVTGKGPQRAMYEQRIRDLQLQRVQIRTMWLSTADYPRMLGAADLGVCLHFSTSGLDLPMKVVDMFGCGTPVCAIGFPCLDELVKHEKNGLVFKDATQLAEQLLSLFDGFPDAPSASRLGVLRAGVAEFQAQRWQDNWERNVQGMFTAVA